MDVLTILGYLIAIVETACLFAALGCAAKALHEKKFKRRQGKKGAKDSKLIEKTVSAFYRKAGYFFGAYLILNFIRLYSGIFG